MCAAGAVGDLEKRWTVAEDPGRVVRASYYDLDSVGWSCVVRLDGTDAHPDNAGGCASEIVTGSSWCEVCAASRGSTD